MRIYEMLALVLIFALCSYNCNENSNIEHSLPVAVQAISHEVSVKDLYGQWVPIKNISLPVSALDDETVKKLMNIRCLFGNDISSIFSDTCFAPQYSIKGTNAVAYFGKKWPNIQKGYIGITEDSLYEIKLTCKEKAKYNSANSLDFVYSILYTRRNDRLFIINNGVFFEFERLRSRGQLITAVDKEIEFVGNQTILQDESTTMDSLRDIASALKQDATLTVTIEGNTDNTNAAGLNGHTTINNKDGIFMDLLLGRAQIVADLLIKKLGANPKQIKVSVGRMGYKKSTTVILKK